MNKTPLHTVLFGMFPNALRALAEHAQFGNEKHNPGEPLHWSFDKSTQHADCVLSHLAKAGQTDPETGRSHTEAAFWRMAALLETEKVNAGAEPGFAVRFEGEKPVCATYQVAYRGSRLDFTGNAFATYEQAWECAKTRAINGGYKLDDYAILRGTK